MNLSTLRSALRRSSSCRRGVGLVGLTNWHLLGRLTSAAWNTERMGSTPRKRSPTDFLSLRCSGVAVKLDLYFLSRKLQGKVNIVQPDSLSGPRIPKILHNSPIQPTRSPF